MEVTITYKFDDCRKCPYKGEFREMGASFDTCDHREAKGWPYAHAYKDKQQRTGTPDWCPLLKEK